MARVNVYNRFVDAVYSSDVNMENKLNYLEDDMIFKKELGDPENLENPKRSENPEDSEVPDQHKFVFPSPNISTRNENNIAVTTDRPTVLIDCRERKTENNSKFDSHVCEVCFLSFNSFDNLQYHKKTTTISQFGCKKCCVYFSSNALLTFHKRSFLCKRTHTNRRKVFCHFCKEFFAKKSVLQAHLFHLHGDLIFCRKNGMSKKSGIQSKEYAIDFLKNITSDTSFTQSNPLKSSHKSPPRKKMRQSTLAEFLSVVGKEVTSKISAKKINDTNSVIMSVDTSNPTSDSESSEMSKFVKHTNRDTLLSRTPFVRIHVDHSFMIKILQERINTVTTSSVEGRRLSYNLRPQKKSLSTDDLNFQGLSSSSSRCGTPTYKRYEKPWIQDRNLQVKFNCKDCTVLLKRLDESVIQASRKPKELGKQVISRKEDCGSANRVRRGRIASGSIKSVTSEDTVDRRKSHKCRVCLKRFSVRENMRKHMELSHTIYRSCICNSRFTTMDKLVNHYMIHHFAVKSKECRICLETFETATLAKQHMASSHCVKIIRFKKSTILDDVDINCSIARKRNRCRGCSKRFRLRSCLVQHEKLCRYSSNQNDKKRTPNMGWSSLRYSEDQDKFTTNVNDVSETVEPSSQKSSDEHPALLDPCRLQTLETETQTSNNSDISLMETTGYQSDTSDKAHFPCTICGVKFQTFQNLCIHERIFCRPANSRCNICGTGFPSSKQLQIHMVTTHAPSCIKSYKFFCKFCKQGFLKKINCQIHERHFHPSQVHQLPKDDCSWKVSPCCTICNLKFESYKRFIEHNMYYYTGQTFMCTNCNISCQGMYLLHRHNKLVHYPKNTLRSCNFKCNICDEVFNYETHFLAHTKHVHGSDTPVLMSNWTAIREHNYALVANEPPAKQETLHVTPKMYTCNVCSLNFINQRDLSAHNLEYSTDGNLQCDRCNRKCCTVSALVRHQSLNHTGSDVNRNYKCRYCGEVWTTSMSMLCHEKHFHTNPTKQPVNKRFDRTTEKYVLEETDFSCLICQLKFASGIGLKNHLLEYSNIGPFACNICERKFTELCLLMVHEVKHSRAHSNMLKHRCPICDEGFDNSTVVRTHVLHMHRYETFRDVATNVPDMNEIPDNVSSDDYTLASKLMNVFKKYISIPVNTLQQQNRVQCNKCDMTFSSTKSLRKHNARYVNYGAYGCSICERKFPWKAMLKQHVQKHLSSIAPLLKYKCPQCEEKFRNTVSVYSHVIHIHGKDKLQESPDKSSGNSSNNKIQRSSCIEERPSSVQQPPDTENAKDSERPVEKVIESAGESSEIFDIGQSVAPATNDQLVPESVVEESTPVDKQVGVPNSKDRMFYYTCAECDSKHSTMKAFLIHFETTHTTGKVVKECSEVVNAGNEADSAISEEKSADQLNACDPNSSIRDNTNTSSNDMANSKESLLVTKKAVDDSDAIEVVWEAKQSNPDVIVIEDMDVEIIQNDCQSTVRETKEISLVAENTKPKLKN